jgi:hypothetical protein
MNIVTLTMQEVEKVHRYETAYDMVHVINP